MFEGQKLKKMAENSKNGVPKDKNGNDIVMGGIAFADVSIEQREIKIKKKKFFIGPRTTRICGKIIIVGSKESFIQPRGEQERKVKNDDITVIA